MSARQLHIPDSFALRPSQSVSPLPHTHAALTAPAASTRTSRAQFAALRTAIVEGDDEGFRALMEKSPRLDGTDELSGKTLTHFAIERHRPDMLSVLLQNGAPRDVADRRCRRTPLHAALHIEDARAVTVLLAHGADTEVPDYNGYTPLKSAVQDGKPEIEAILRAHGANGQAEHIVINPRGYGSNGRPKFERVLSADILLAQELDAVSGSGAAVVSKTPSA